MKKKITALLLIFTLLTANAGPLFAWQEDTFFEKLKKLGISFSGYYKNLFSTSKTADTKERFFLDINRLRLNYNQRFSKSLSMQLTYDQEGLIHDFHNNPEFSLIRQRSHNNLAFIDLEKAISDKKHIYQRRSLYRAFIKYETDNLSVTGGKQNIDWGRLRFYSPFDLFNQPSPLDLESDERMGFDAINIELSSSNFSGVNFIYGPESNSSNTSFGLRLFKKIESYDLFLIAAKVRDDKTAGFGFDGYIKDAGFRAEFTYTKIKKEKFPRLALGLDYNFTNRIYVLAEYFYNGGANGDYDTFTGSLIESRRRLSLEKNLIGLYADYEITPLMKISLSSIIDPKGQSAYFNPALHYNITRNCDFSIGGQFFSEKQASEFQNSQHLFYTKLKIFF